MLSPGMPKVLVLDTPSKKAVYATNVIIVCSQTRWFLLPGTLFFSKLHIMNF